MHITLHVGYTKRTIGSVVHKAFKSSEAFYLDKLFSLRRLPPLPVDNAPPGKTTVELHGQLLAIACCTIKNIIYIYNPAAYCDLSSAWMIRVVTACQ